MRLGWIFFERKFSRNNCFKSSKDSLNWLSGIFKKNSILKNSRNRNWRRVVFQIRTLDLIDWHPDDMTLYFDRNPAEINWKSMEISKNLRKWRKRCLGCFVFSMLLLVRRSIPHSIPSLSWGDFDWFRHMFLDRTDGRIRQQADILDDIMRMGMFRECCTSYPTSILPEGGLWRGRIGSRLNGQHAQVPELTSVRSGTIVRNRSLRFIVDDDNMIWGTVSRMIQF